MLDKYAHIIAGWENVCKNVCDCQTNTRLQSTYSLLILWFSLQFLFVCLPLINCCIFIWDCCCILCFLQLTHNTIANELSLKRTHWKRWNVEKRFCAISPNLLHSAQQSSFETGHVKDHEMYPAWRTSVFLVQNCSVDKCVSSPWHF